MLYWKINLIRYILDVMYIEKNFFENVFNIVMDLNGKIKDNVKVRMDMEKFCKRTELELKKLFNGKIVKLKVRYVFNLE